MARVVALIPDLLLGSRIEGMLTAAGHQVTLCPGEDAARSTARGADVFVVDLASDEIDGATLVESMRRAGELGPTRTLGFYAHVDAEARSRARAAGFDLAVPRSRLARDGDELVRQLAAG
jgi:CheY-like chemotaxis protein